MLTRTQHRFGRAALRAAVIGMAAAAMGGGIAATANAAETAGARDIDWSNATLDLHGLDHDCPGGPVTFKDGVADIDNGPAGKTRYTQGPVKFGDVNRDGRADAVLSVVCSPESEVPRPLTAVYAYGVEAGAPAKIGAVMLPPLAPQSYQVHAGTVTVKARTEVADSSSPLLTFKLRWDGKTFQERSGKGAYTYDWGNAPLALPFKAESVPMGGAFPGEPEPRPCPRATVDFESPDGNLRYSRQGEFRTADDFEYGIRALEFGDVNHDGVTDVRVELYCYDGKVYNTPNRWNYLYTVKGGKAQVLSYLTTGFSHGSTDISQVTLSPGKVSLVQAAEISHGQYARDFTWTANGLKAEQPLPDYPDVDVAP